MDLHIPLFPNVQGKSIVIDGVTYCPVLRDSGDRLQVVSNPPPISSILTHTPIALNAAGNATICVVPPSMTFHILHLLLVASAAVTIRFLSNVTYIMGSAAVGAALAANGGWVENGSIYTPIYQGAATGDDFIINLSTAVAVAGHVVWYYD